jgi:spermidine/putrescine transport system substrate-binding protein
LDAQWLNPPCDPGNRYSAAYFWGTMAVGVRADKVTKTVRGFEALFDPDFRGRITMLNDAENVVAAVLLHLGLPMNSVDPRHLARVQELLAQQKSLVQAYTSDAFKERLIAGDAWVALGWGGDLAQAADEATEGGLEIRVVVPGSGTMLWLDSMAIPAAASEVELAHEFINYLLDPDIAVRNAEHVNYATPNRTAFRRLPAETRADERTYPPATTLAGGQWLRDRGADIAKIEAVWRAVKG